MRCTKCGAEMVDSDSFCPKCGTPVTKSNYDNGYNYNNTSTSAYYSQSQYTSDKSLEKNNPVPYAKQRTTRNIFLVATVIIGILAFVFILLSSNSDLEPAVDFHGEDADYGEYVSLDLVYTLGAYTEKLVDTKTDETTAEYYFCLAVDDENNTFIIKVPKDYYDETLYPALSENDYNQVVWDSSQCKTMTVYGKTTKLDTDVADKIEEDFNEDEQEILSQFTGCEIDLVEKPIKKGSKYVGFMVFLLFLFAISLKLTLSKNKKYKKIKRVCEDYTNLRGIQSWVLSAPVYKDMFVAANTEFIVSIRNEFAIVSTKDVLCLYEKVHKKNKLVQTVELIAVNKYGEEIVFGYGGSESEEILNAIGSLVKLCPNAITGYSKESRAYISQYKQTRP